MLATLSPGIVEGPDWVFEEKYDGIRAIAGRERGQMRAGIVFGAIREIHSMHSVDADQQDPLNVPLVFAIVGIRLRCQYSKG